MEIGFVLGEKIESTNIKILPAEKFLKDALQADYKSMTPHTKTLKTLFYPFIISYTLLCENIWSISRCETNWTLCLPVSSSYHRSVCLLVCCLFCFAKYFSRILPNLSQSRNQFCLPVRQEISKEVTLKL